jgi:hypothetical protein
LTESIPANLTQEDAEIAIVAMLTAHQQAPDDQSTHTVVLANPLGATLWDQYQSGHIPIKGWFLESWEPGILELGYQRRLH